MSREGRLPKKCVSSDIREETTGCELRHTSDVRRPDQPPVMSSISAESHDSCAVISYIFVATPSLVHYAAGARCATRKNDFLSLSSLSILLAIPPSIRHPVDTE